jgi:D-hydroxyproline dehydrogenase subunit gamma
MFKLLPESLPDAITVYIDGVACKAPPGVTAAAAMLMHAAGPTRTTPVSGEGRAAYCMMGVCFECLLEINGDPNQQGCLVIVKEGMRIGRQQGRREVHT